MVVMEYSIYSKPKYLVVPRRIQKGDITRLFQPAGEHLIWHPTKIFTNAHGNPHPAKQCALPGGTKTQKEHTQHIIIILLFAFIKHKSAFACLHISGGTISPLNLASLEEDITYKLLMANIVSGTPDGAHTIRANTSMHSESTSFINCQETLCDRSKTLTLTIFSGRVRHKSCAGLMP